MQLCLHGPFDGNIRETTPRLCRCKNQIQWNILISKAQPMPFKSESWQSENRWAKRFSTFAEPEVWFCRGLATMVAWGCSGAAGLEIPPQLGLMSRHMRGNRGFQCSTSALESLVSINKAYFSHAGGDLLKEGILEISHLLKEAIPRQKELQS
jgi:hypothetical protein